MCALPTHQNSPHIHDSLAWAFSKDGWFSIKSAYLLARDLNPLNSRLNSVSWVWKLEAPPKILFFLWLCLHNSIPTCVILGSRGLSLSPLCPICSEENESIDHLLRRCKTAAELWVDLKFPLCLVDSFIQPPGGMAGCELQNGCQFQFSGHPVEYYFYYEHLANLDSQK